MTSFFPLDIYANKLQICKEPTDKELQYFVKSEYPFKNLMKLVLYDL